MKLSDSAVCRLSLEGSIYNAIDVIADKSPTPPITQSRSVNIYFDLGTKKKHEKAVLMIGSTDFNVLLQEMMKADREATIKAFATAVLSAA